ncbi:MAG: hypothetical protein AABW58_01445 [Nanoarchaeota archaeon]
MPPAAGPTPAEQRINLGRLLKKIEKSKQFVDFSSRIEEAVTENVLTPGQADAFRDLLSEAYGQSSFEDQAELLGRLGNGIKTEICYELSRRGKLVTIDPADLDAVAVRRDTYVSAGRKWYSKNKESL